MLISFLAYSLLLISFTLITDVQLVTSHITTVSNIMQQQQSIILIKNTFDKYKRASKLLEFYLIKEVERFEENLLPEQTKNLIFQTDFKELRGILYSFFDKNSILISVNPYDISQQSNEEIKCNWQYYMNIDGTDITEGDFKKREQAEFVAFQKAFEFLDTKLFIKDTSNRFYDESSDSSCLNVNWNHLNKVLNHKRKSLISNNG